MNSETRLFVGENLIFVAVGLAVPSYSGAEFPRYSHHGELDYLDDREYDAEAFSTVLAILILHERPASLVLLGVALTVCGLFHGFWGGEKTSYKRIELIYPFLCALLFSMKDIAVRWGLGDGTGQPILAAGIALTSTVEIYLITRFVQSEEFVWPAARVCRWFIASGVFTGGSFLFMYVAYSLERVSIVAPLVNSYTVFVSLLTPLMAREIETITARKLAGAALVVAGIFAVSLGKD